MRMKPDNYRRLVTRAFIETGADPPDGLILYIDMLENALLDLEKQTMRRKQKRRVVDLRDIMESISRREYAVMVHDAPPRS